jgi:hypothetical protein
MKWTIHTLVLEQAPSLNNEERENSMSMEVTAVVLYDSALAHYDVKINNDGNCEARLAQYKGREDRCPPQHITLHKEGRHWVGDVPTASLSDDIGYAIEMKAKPFIEDRKRGRTHPAA